MHSIVNVETYLRKTQYKKCHKKCKPWVPVLLNKVKVIPAPNLTSSKRYIYIYIYIYIYRIIFNFSLHFWHFFFFWYLPERGFWQRATPQPQQLTLFPFLPLFAVKALYFLTSAPFFSLFGRTVTIMRSVRKTVKSASQLCHVCMSFWLSSLLSVPSEQLGFNWTDFNEIWYSINFENLLKNIKFV